MGQAGENSLYLVDGKPCKVVEQQFITKFFLVHFSLLWKPLLFKLPKQVRDSLTFEETKGEGFDWKSEIIKR